jgi:hypothetical protein
MNPRQEALKFYLTRGYRVGGPPDTLFGEVRHVRIRKDVTLTKAAADSANTFHRDYRKSL